MKHKIILVYAFYVRLLTSWLPDAPAVMRFRGWLLSIFMKKCGANFQVSQGAIIKGLEHLCVGKNVYIGPNVNFILRVGCRLGDNVLIGPGCVIVDGNHGFDNVYGYRFAKGGEGPICIESGSWVGANCVITKSVNIGKNSVLGANSVAVGNYEGNEVYVVEKAKKLYS